MRKVTKKMVAAVMSLAMVATLGIGKVNFVKADDSATVTFEMYYGEWIVEPTEIEVTADLSDKYADKIGFNDTVSEPSVLDALIAEHVEMFGEDFDVAADDYFKLSDKGWVLKVFGEDTQAVGYRVNGLMVDSMDMAVVDGDNIYFMYYMDTAFYSDFYVSFDKTQVTAKPGETVTLVASQESYDSNWNTVMLPAEDLVVYVNGEEVGTTDEDGAVSFTAGEEGKYFVTAASEDYDIFAPYCVLTVSEEIDTTVADATTIDATTVDATTVDATTVDATTVDATTADATTVDATTAEVTTVAETTTAKAEIGKASIKKVATKKKSAKKVKVTVKKVNGADGYLVKVYTSKKNAKADKKAIAKASSKKVVVTVSNKKIANKKNLFVRACAFITDGKKKKFGELSTVKSVKIK